MNVSKSLSRKKRRLTASQEAVLEWLTDHSGLSFYDAVKLGGSGMTLSSLADKGLLIKRIYANGPVWELSNDGILLARELFA